MLTLPTLETDAPRTLAEAVEALRHDGSRVIAGGTDLLPNLKHGLGTGQTKRLVQLGQVAALRHVVDDGDALAIGASVTLAELARHPVVSTLLPSLALAAASVASPLQRNLATLGGNIHLDTRCRYVNQTEFWRASLGGCLKSEGAVCHVVPSGKRCVAALSSDTVPALISLDAVLELAGPDGLRRVALADYYQADGCNHTGLRTGELMTRVLVPKPVGPRRCTYVKWSVRNSIDFPLVSVALRFDLSAAASDAAITRATVVVGALSARPRVVTGLEDVLGASLTEPSVADTIAMRVHAQCRPVENIPYDAAYRRTMLRVLTRRAIRTLVA